MPIAIFSTYYGLLFLPLLWVSRTDVLRLCNIMYTDLFRWCNLIKCWVFLEPFMYMLAPQLFYCAYDTLYLEIKPVLKILAYRWLMYMQVSFLTFLANYSTCHARVFYTHFYAVVTFLHLYDVPYVFTLLTPNGWIFSHFNTESTHFAL